MQLTWPGSWNVTTPLPTYQKTTNYNDANQPTTTVTSTNPTGQGYTTTNVYDSTTGALIGLSNTGSPNANVATLTFTPRALINTITYLTTTGTGLSSEQYSYDANLRPTGASATWLSGSGSSGTILSQNRTYDPASNVTSLSTTLAAVPGVSGSGGSETQNYCYDEQNRLVWAGNSGTQPGSGNGTCGSGTLSNSLTGAGYGTGYIYTNLGQLWQGPQGNSGTPSQYLYCDSSHPHQLTGLYQSGSTCSNKTGQSYASLYDAWGNVISRTVNSTSATLSYDGLDHLTKWDAGSSGQEQYVYDAAGNRVLRRSTSAGSTTMTVYAFGLEEHRYSGSGVHQVVGGDTYYYSLGGMLIGEFDGTNTNMFLTDALGSVIEAISATANSAAVQGNQVYGPYGTSRYQQGNIGTAKGFTGQYTDSLSGLDYYNARYYDPVVGRFLSADTVESNLQGLDPYAYVQDNPETHNDPSGHLGGGPGQNNLYAELARLRKNDPNFLKVLELLWMVVDFFTGIKSIIHDIQTLLNANVSWTDKLLALGDLALNVALDASMVTGLGEIGRGGELLAKVGKGVLDVITGIVKGEDVGRAVDDVLHTAEDLVHGACSFTSATRVTTDHGKQAIGTLHVGERVLAYNPKTGKMELEPILHVWVNHDHDLVNLTLTTMATKGQHGRVTIPTSEVVHTNQKHPFMTLEQGFLPVGKIKLGMHILQADGHFGVVTGWKVVPGMQVMYNLEVAQDHTFTVGTGQWVVHNCGDTGFTLKNGFQVTLSDQGLRRVFSEHAAEWFGRRVTDADRAAFYALIKDAMKSQLTFFWDSRGRPTIAVLAREKFGGQLRFFVVQFDRNTGELVTAFIPKPGQLGAMLRELGI